MQFDTVIVTVYRVHGHAEHWVGAASVVLPSEVAVAQGICAYGRVRNAFRAVAARTGETDIGNVSDQLRVSLLCSGPHGGMLASASTTIRMFGEESSAFAEACSRLTDGAAAGEFPPGLCIRFPT